MYKFNLYQNVFGFFVCLFIFAIDGRHGHVLHSKSLPVPNFTLLATTPSSGGVNVMEYYVSESKATQTRALQDCIINFDGRLVTILNHVQFDVIATEIESRGLIDQHFWTAGTQVDSDWFWLSTGDQIQPSQLIWHPEHVQLVSTDHGLTLFGDLDTTGMCNTWNTSFNLRYICEVEMKSISEQ